MMKIKRFTLFVTLTWFLSTGPLLYSKFFLSGGKWITNSLIAGSLTSGTIVVVLLIGCWIARFSKMLVLNYILPALYLLLAISLLVVGLLTFQTNSQIWEGLTPILILLCPITIFSNNLASRNFELGIFLMVACGTAYYYLLNKIFRLFVYSNSASKPDL